jgi:DNA-binding transcriptional LysR family regulator
MNLDTITLQIFIALSETKSFSKVAEKVGRTQSAISQQINKLEKLTDKKLFNRGKNLSLTEDGETFLKYAKQIYLLHCEAFDQFNDPELEGEVNFGIPEDFASIYLSDVLADFTRIHPRILLNIDCDLTLNLYEKFKNNEFDLALVKMNQPEGFPYGQEVWSEPLVWIGEESVLREGQPTPLVLSPKPCVYRESAIKALDKVDRKWRLVFSSSSLASKIAAVKANMGLTILPKKLVSKELKIIESEKLPKLKDIHVSLIKKTNDNSAVNSFEEFVLEKIRF